VLHFCELAWRKNGWAEPGEKLLNPNIKAVAIAMWAILHWMASSSVSPLGRLVLARPWAIKLTIILDNQIEVISFSDWDQSTWACWMTLLI